MRVYFYVHHSFGHTQKTQKEDNNLQRSPCVRESWEGLSTSTIGTSTGSLKYSNKSPILENVTLFDEFHLMVPRHRVTSVIHLLSGYGTTTKSSISFMSLARIFE